MNDIIASMISQAKHVLTHAYAPYSKFRVAACLYSENGNFYTGVNVENASYGLTICAESSAICQMITAGKQKILSMVVMNGEGTLCPPCGACLQRIAEFANSKTVIHLCSHQAPIKSLTIEELLPYTFRFKP
ncbi:Cytidine deaminase [Legionella massiliensis]|uniref:Cytidine deaminase n=1 Tax=Legionella massiliensis TaxID=1034943 RepID=A0A078L1Q3_9GAMM|nr:cytidine deaminase [Legionella massiliensis]CDZ79182.1 Cytidine deaminase [Legionella massiliensis]CEE14920.1 Cytidine deaminase [Legionella massiliensis]